MRHFSLTTTRLLCILALGFFTRAELRGQSAQDMPSAKTYQGTLWRAVPDLQLVLSAERERNAVLKNNPELPETDRATYAAYDRLLALLIEDLPGGAAVEEIAVHDFQKVLADAPQDPVMKALDPDLFRHHFNQLIELMTQPQAPLPARVPNGR